MESHVYMACRLTYSGAPWKAVCCKADLQGHRSKALLQLVPVSGWILTGSLYMYMLCFLPLMSSCAINPQRCSSSGIQLALAKLQVSARTLAWCHAFIHAACPASGANIQHAPWCGTSSAETQTLPSSPPRHSLQRHLLVNLRLMLCLLIYLHMAGRQSFSP